MFQFLHGADFHLDSPFSALPPELAAQRRRESRAMLGRMADYVNARGIRLVLLAGDLLDSGSVYRDTAEQLALELGRMEALVCIATGNHDFYTPGGLWDTVAWPENVHIFRSGQMEAVEIPALGAVVHGAAFTGPEQAESLLAGFSAPADGRVHLGVLHGEVGPSRRRYDPISRQDIAQSGLAYLALGHVHKGMEPQRCGATLWAWPGCPEGRGFDEAGEKGVLCGTVSDDGAVEATFVPFARRRYEIVEADVTGRTALEAAEQAIHGDTRRDLYRIILTGEADGTVDAGAVESALRERFYALEVRDETRVAADVWAGAGEESLRGLFLRTLRQKWDSAPDEETRRRIALAARFGLAALEHRDLG